MKYFIDKVQEDKDIGRTAALWADSGHCPCTPCGLSSSQQGSCPSSSSFSSHLRSPSSPYGTCGGEMPLVHCGMVMSVRQAGHWSPGSLPSFLGVTLVELPWLPLPPSPLLGLTSEPVADFLVMNPMHTFLWLCRAEDDMKACFRHFPHP